MVFLSLLHTGFAGPEIVETAEETYIPVNFKTVVIDPGHGGLDSGTIWYGMAEEVLTLDLAKRLERQLRQRGLQAVVPTRTEDVSITLLDRIKLAEKHPRPILVSLHFDAMPDRTAHGCKVFVSPHAQETTKHLAISLVHELHTLGEPVCRGVKTQNFLLLRESKIPAVIVEGGFMSNPAESQLLRTEEFREKLATALAEGILAYGELDLAQVAKRDSAATQAN